MDKPKVATVWLEGCSGCHMSFLDLDEKLLDVLAMVELAVSPVTDIKDFDFRGITVGIIEGGIGNREHEEIARKIRKCAKVLVAWGDCAVFGGINAMRNGIPVKDLLHACYRGAAGAVGESLPIHEELPPLIDQVLPVNRVVPVEVYIPGCPPAPEAIAYGLMEILKGRMPVVLPRALMHFD